MLLVFRMKNGCFLLSCLAFAGLAYRGRGRWNIQATNSKTSHINTLSSGTSHKPKKNCIVDPLLSLSNFLFVLHPVPGNKYVFPNCRHRLITSTENGIPTEQFRQFKDRISDDDPVLFSGRIMAAIRALESQRESPLVDDKYSERLAGKNLIKEYIEGRKQKGIVTGPSFVSPIVVRTKYFDDKLSTWLENVSAQGHEEPTMLILGAGMDTRSWRLPQLKGAHVIEADSYVVLDWKKRKLGEKPNSKSWIDVKGDITSDEFWDYLGVTDRPRTWPSNSFPSNRAPSFILMEGVSMYLDENGMQNLLSSVNSWATQAGSWLCLSFVDEYALARAKNSSSDMLQQWNWALNGSQEEVVRKFFKDNLGTDWKIHELCDRNSVQVKFGIDERFDYEPSIHTFFMVLERTKAAELTEHEQPDTTGLFAVGAASAGFIFACSVVQPDLSLWPSAYLYVSTFR